MEWTRNLMHDELMRNEREFVIESRLFGGSAITFHLLSTLLRGFGLREYLAIDSNGLPGNTLCATWLFGCF